MNSSNNNNNNNIHRFFTQLFRGRDQGQRQEQQQSSQQQGRQREQRTNSSTRHNGGNVETPPASGSSEAAAQTQIPWFVPVGIMSPEMAVLFFGNPPTDAPTSSSGNNAASVDSSWFETAAATAASFMQPQPQQGPPPASTNALRQLPVVKVSPEDLVEPVNRECSICLDAVHLKEHVIRLPCAHIFHRPCVLDWLSKHCTCPVCRYELATDDPSYERGRIQRMLHRKPRFARHELQRMSIKQLKGLLEMSSHNRGLPHRASRSISSYHFVDKEDLISRVIQSGCIELIHTPEPVAYPLSRLKTMSVSQLKQCMNQEAGVFFDPIDVIEKDDMLRIFIMSGRLHIVPEEEPTEPKNDEGDKSSICDRADDDKIKGNVGLPCVVETVIEEHQGDTEIDEREDKSLVMEENQSFEVDRNVDDRAYFEPPPTDAVQLSQDVLAGDSIHTLPLNELNSEVSTGDQLFDGNDGSSMEENGMDVSDGRRKRQRFHPSHSPGDPIDQTSVESQFQNLTITELLDLARERSIDVSDCMGREQVIDRLSSDHVARQSLQKTREPGNNCIDDRAEVAGASLLSGAPVHRSPLEAWSVSQLRALANVSSVDLSHCVTKEEMVEKLEGAADDRPHIAGYLDSLSPIVMMTVPQLRSLARDWQVSVSDCLEKGDIMQRLIEHIPRREV